MAPSPGHPSRPLCGHPRPPSPLPPHCPHPTEQAFTYTDPSLKPQCSWGLVGPSPPTLRCPRAWRRPPLLPDGGLLSVPRVPLPGFPQGPPRAVCSAWSPGPPSVLMATSADSRPRRTLSPRFQPSCPTVPFLRGFRLHTHRVISPVLCSCYPLVDTWHPRYQLGPTVCRPRCWLQVLRWCPASSVRLGALPASLATRSTRHVLRVL